jgi:hypothetical protein|tara:strand:+ start:884 stop:1105 length:222 start_codon:yes stop_codon:yes gene_type:complete
MAKAQTSKKKVTVKESMEGKPYLAFELCKGKEIPDLERANIGFFLKDGIDIKEAKQLAQAMNDKIEYFYMTKF